MSKDWLPLSELPPDIREFLVARYAPTSWTYDVDYIFAPDYIEAGALRAFLAHRLRYAVAWMPAPEPPASYGRRSSGGEAPAP